MLHSIQNNTIYNEEYKNNYIPLIALEKRIQTQINQINPNFIINRQKRGILNPLGSLIKCITGNLDQTDAEKYDKQITQLQGNENKLKDIVYDQITILEKSIKQFQNTISNITHNQNILKYDIMQIEETIKKVALHQNTDHQYFRTHVVINQIIMMYQTIFDIFEKIEVAISFAKINVLHNSITDPIELIKEIQSLKSFLNTDVLPLDATINNILNFEKIIEIKSYSKENIITFILELPLVESEMYHYYQLYPIPIPVNQSHEFYFNFPHKPYLALSNAKYSYMDQKCTQLLPNEYLCKEAHTTYMNDAPPCAVQLITYQSKTTTCQPLHVQLQEVQVTKIIDGKWIVTIPNRLVVPINCKNSKDNTPLFGSYLIEASNQCSLQIKSFVLQTYKTSKLSFEAISLPNFNFSKDYYQKYDVIFNPPTIDLNIVNFKETKEIEASLQKQERRINEMTKPITYKQTSFWTILLYMFILIICIFSLYKMFKNKYFKKLTKKETNNGIII